MAAQYSVSWFKGEERGAAQIYPPGHLGVFDKKHRGESQIRQDFIIAQTILAFLNEHSDVTE